LNDIKELTDALLKFRDERDWAQFHNGGFNSEVQLL